MAKFAIKEGYAFLVNKGETLCERDSHANIYTPNDDMSAASKTPICMGGMRLSLESLRYH